MLARIAAALLLAAAASLARADEPYAPPGTLPLVSAGPTSADTPAEPSADPSAVLSSYRGYEWGLGGLGGYGGGSAELSVLFDLDKLALGAMVTLGKAGEEPGAGFLLVGGPRFRLSESRRLDVLADFGITVYGKDGSDSGLVNHTETSGSRKVLPTVGVRTGVTFKAKSGGYLSVGAGIRYQRETPVTYTRTECEFLVVCKTTTKSTRYGGTAAGVFLTFGASTPAQPVDEP